MKASKFTDAQKAFIVKQGNEGTTVAEIAARLGLALLGECSFTCLATVDTIIKNGPTAAFGINARSCSLNQKVKPAHQSDQSQKI